VLELVFFLVDPSRFRLAHQTSFVRRHSGWSTTPGLRWIVSCILVKVA
jgi:mlo protein